jgi:hypothetical protein
MRSRPGEEDGVLCILGKEDKIGRRSKVRSSKAVLLNRKEMWCELRLLGNDGQR